MEFKLERTNYSEFSNNDLKELFEKYPKLKKYNIRKERDLEEYPDEEIYALFITINSMKELSKLIKDVDTYNCCNGLVIFNSIYNDKEISVLEMYDDCRE